MSPSKTPKKQSGSTGGKTKVDRKAKSSASSGKITTYASALRWLAEHTDYERMRIVRYNTTTFNLDRMKKLLKALGNPEKQLKCVHVAGSKGKGSTCAMLESMLRGCGYTVGLFSSPHLTDLRERIQINGQNISQSDLTELLGQVKTKTARMKDKPSFFEIITACALMHFADQAVDLAILETGLGGRLDATNVVTPLVCGITQISHDHTHVLGEDLRQIAREKAGIMKKGVPVITIPQVPEVAEVLRQEAERREALLEETGREIEFSYRFEATRELGPHMRVCLSTPNGHYEHLPVPLKGEHQALNCGLAIAMLDKLREQGFHTPEEKIIAGLAATRLPGRMEMVWDEPRILVDGAHNPASIAALIKAIGAHVPYDSLVMIFGCAADKELVKLLREVNLGADKVIFTKARSNPRAADPNDLLSLFSEFSDKMAQVAETLPEALELAARAVSREDLICVTGSFYLVGEAKKYLEELAARRAAQRN